MVSFLDRTVMFPQNGAGVKLSTRKTASEKTAYRIIASPLYCRTSFAPDEVSECIACEYNSLSNVKYFFSMNIIVLTNNYASYFYVV